MKNNFVYLFYIFLFIIACAEAPPTSTPPPAKVLDEEGPATTEPPLEKLQKDILEKSRRQITDFLTKQSDDPNLVQKLGALDSLIDDLSNQIGDLEAKTEPLTFQDRNQHKALIDLLAKSKAKREEEIAASYKEYRVEFKDMDNYFIPESAKQELRAIRSGLKLACSAKRQIIILGFGCSEGPPPVTKRVSDSRANSVKLWLMQYAGCKKRDILDEGLGVEILEEDLSKVDPMDKQLLLEKSRHAVLLLPR